MIEKLRLENFKGVVEGEIELDKLTILVGPNNSGKTTILEALFLAPNPLRQVPYVPSMAVALLSAYHKTLSEVGYSFLLNRYVAENASIKVDEKELLFTKSELGLMVCTNYSPPGYALNKCRTGETDLFYLGSLRSDGLIEADVRPLITDNTLLLSTKLVNFAHEYLLRKWVDIANTRSTLLVARDVSKYVQEDYVNITAEPFTGGVVTLFVMLSDGARIRLSDLGHGVHLYIINRLLYEHYKLDVILWDDLETHLNPRLLIHVAEWFTDLIDEGKQVIVSTHSLEAVETLTTFVEDATVLLTSIRDGKLKARKIKLDELKTLSKLGMDPRMAEAFL